MIRKETKFVILTGAGISAESGIRTFRDSNGLWENHRIEEVATPEGWKANPQLVWNFYQQRRKQLLEVEPNQGHEALAQLEDYFDNFLLVTQNVDDLHERAGSKNLIHMHGELAKLRCEACHHVEDMMDDEHLGEEFLTCLHCEGRLRPHIVWFNEMPMRMAEIEKHCPNVMSLLPLVQVVMSILRPIFFISQKDMAHTPLVLIWTLLKTSTFLMNFSKERLEKFCLISFKNGCRNRSNLFFLSSGLQGNVFATRV